jgi:ParB family transcriptional regulator, chromosome partitioning protein
MNKELDRSQRKALGKGLSALLPSRTAPAPPPSEPVSAAAPPKPALPEQFEDFQNIPLDRILPSEEQPRDMFDSGKLKELSQSIRANGLLQPITVWKDGGTYRIIAGERRWRAARLAGLTEIPVLVRQVEKDKLLELALIENIQREDLNPIEIATAFQRLHVAHGLSHEQIAERTGKDRSTVTNFLRLLKLSPRAREELSKGNISVGHARALLNLPESEQAHACELILAKQLSVRETENLAKNIKSVAKRSEGAPEAKEAKATKEQTEQIDPNVRAALDEMAMALGTRVRLVAKSPTAGRLEVEYYSQDDLDRIYSVIVKQ